MATRDPTAKAASEDTAQLSVAQKVDGALKLSQEIGTCMLTSRTPDGRLASRPMATATMEGDIYSFYFNQESGKTDDLKTDNQVNLSFLNPKSGDWVSISGTASINTDRSKVKKHWSTFLQAWFDDKGDGKHTGDENDPRVALLDVHPEEIRWFSSDGTLKFLFETATAAVTGKPASVGKLVVVTADEIKQHQQLHAK